MYYIIILILVQEIAVNIQLFKQNFSLDRVFFEKSSRVHFQSIDFVKNIYQ